MGNRILIHVRFSFPPRSAALIIENAQHSADLGKQKENVDFFCGARFFGARRREKGRDDDARRALRAQGAGRDWRYERLEQAWRFLQARWCASGRSLAGRQWRAGFEAFQESACRSILSAANVVGP
ncbi:hypothetical protein [Roseiarcus sp.]|uniref:hypothetical protein n=1 Tax=Roseiarcus sp. TaxID=1969460 RepID=UPI003D14CA97